MSKPDLLTCPTPWCNSKQVHTTTFINSNKDKETGVVTQKVEVEHSCTVCNVHTPKMPAGEAAICWNSGR
jgi:hypothetical protein